MIKMKLRQGLVQEHLNSELVLENIYSSMVARVDEQTVVKSRYEQLGIYLNQTHPTALFARFGLMFYHLLSSLSEQKSGKYDTFFQCTTRST